MTVEPWFVLRVLSRAYPEAFTSDAFQTLWSYCVGRLDQGLIEVVPHTPVAHALKVLHAQYAPDLTSVMLPADWPTLTELDNPKEGHYDGNI